MTRTLRTPLATAAIAIVVAALSGCCSTRTPTSLAELHRIEMEMLVSDCVSEDDKNFIEDRLERHASIDLVEAVVEYWDDNRVVDEERQMQAGEAGDTYRLFLGGLARKLFYNCTSWKGLSSAPEMKEWWRRHRGKSLIEIIKEYKDAK